MPCVAFNKPRPQADQSARRDREDHEGVFVVAGHFDQLAAPLADQFHDRPGALGGRLDHQRLERLVQLAVDFVEDHLRLADRKLVALAAHGFDEDRKVQDAAAGHRELLGARDRLDPRAPRSAPARASAARAGGGWSDTCLRGRPSGEVFTPKVIFSVGSSTFSRGSAAAPSARPRYRRSPRLPARRWRRCRRRRPRGPRRGRGPRTRRPRRPWWA